MADFILGRLKFKWQGDWTTATAYIVDDVVNYNGTSWICVSNHTAGGSFVTDRDADKWEPMVSGLHFAGEWDSATTYETNDVVQHAGSSWISVQDDNTNNTPTPSSSTYWDLLVQGDADSILTTKGDIIYRDTTAATRLPIGSDNAILQVNNSGVPIWSTTINGADDIKLTGQLYGGTGAPASETALGLTNIQALFKSDVDAFAQFAIHNASDGEAASTDFIAYADNGDNDSGWIDMGITSSAFDDPAFGVTGINDGYIFMSAPTGTTGNGNLYISTSGEGAQNDIVFSTGGFEDNTFERMRIVGAAHGSYNAGINLVDDISTTNGKFYIGPSAKALTVDGATATTQLDGGINSTATTITVDSTTGFNTKGYITIGDEVIYYGGKTSTTFTNCNRGYQGTTAASHLDNAVVEQITYVGLTNATAIYTGNADDFVQFAIKNTNSGASASTDLIAYASDGDNDSGWIDLGITSSTYNDPAFTVTGPGTGYLFFSAPATTTGTGDLLIGTDHTGSNNDIVFFTNGFDAGNERLRIVGQGVNAGVEVYADTESTSTTTGALRVDGGIGLQGNLYVGGDVNIVGNITLGGTGNTVETESLSVADPIIRMANGNTASDALDIGFVGTYATTGPATRYTGLVRDASDGIYKLFTEMTANPTTTVDFTGATFASVKTGALESTSSVTSVGVTTTGTLAVNASGGITTNQTTFPLVNTTATTVNFAGAATTISVGASTGTTTFNSTTASSSSTTGAVKIAGGLGVAGAVYVGGATNLQSTLSVTGKTTLSNTTKLQQILEKTTVSATSASGTINFDALTQGVLFYTSNAGGNFTINVRGDGSNTLNSIMDTGDSLTIAFMNTNGGTAYYHTGMQIDGSSVTPKWQGGSAPSSGNTSSIDIYTYTIIKTANATYTVLASQTRFA